MRADSDSAVPSQWVVAAELLIILAAVCVSALGLRTVVMGDSLASRLATVESLVHYGSWHIDRPEGTPRSMFEAATVDKVRLDGHLLSTKPPVLPLAMTAQYAGMRALLGWRLAEPADRRPIVQVMTFLCSVIPFGLALFFFARTLALYVTPAWYRIPPLAMLAFGTQLIGFSPTLNNHVPGAAALMVAIFFALAVGSGQRTAAPWRFVLFGLCGGLVFTLDMPMTVYVALAGLYLLARFPRQSVLWGGLGLAIPLIVHFSAMLISTGSVLPIQMREALYLYEGSPWRNPLGIDGLNEPLLTYLFGMTFGRYGTFLLFPVLLLGIAAVVRALADRELPGRGAILAGFVGFVILTTYYVTRTNNYGGEAYGFRWHMGSMPVLLLMAGPLLARWRPRWGWVLVVALAAVSGYSAWECYHQPWSANEEWTARLIYGPSYAVEAPPAD